MILELPLKFIDITDIGQKTFLFLKYELDFH